MRARHLWVALAPLLLGGAAWALDPGDNVYVRARNTRIYSKPSVTSNVVATLQPGQTPLKWKERVHQGSLPWNKVEVRGKTGYVIGSNLSLTPPRMELVASKGDTGHHVYLSAADAIKGLGGGAKWYAESKLHKPEAVRQVQTAEAVGAQLTDSKVAARARAVGLVPVIGVHK